MAYWLAWAEPRAVEGLAHVVKFFVRNLGGLIRVRQGMPDRLVKAKAFLSSSVWPPSLSRRSRRSPSSFCLAGFFSSAESPARGLADDNQREPHAHLLRAR